MSCSAGYTSGVSFRVLAEFQEGDYYEITAYGNDCIRNSRALDAVFQRMFDPPITRNDPPFFYLSTPGISDVRRFYYYHMRFGEYIKLRRQILHLRHKDMTGIGMAYISDIENGRCHPTGEEIVRILARELRIPEDRIPWLRVYALLDRDPYEYFERVEGRVEMNDKYELCVGATPADVLHILGEPSKEVRFGAQMYWFYADLKLRVVFKDDRVAALETI